jgi:hypothetical protein
MIAVLAAAFALAATPSPAVPQPLLPLASACRFRGEPRDWTAQALTAWDRLDARRLRIVRPAAPAITLFDQACVYRLTPDRRGDFRVGLRRYRTEASPHAGQIALPDGSTVPARRLAFASPMTSSDGRDGMFFIMALPSLWRADAAETRDPARLAMVVFMHEFAHSQQAEGLGERVDALLAGGLAPDADDDVVQDRFASRPGYAAAWARERDLFYQAASAPDALTARARLAEAARAMKARRDRWFRGDDALYAPADDVFLTLEGTGNWAAFAWLTDPQGGAMTRDQAIAFIRGAGTHWSQDQGLGVILAVDRLIPDWPRLAFGPDGVTADMLIAWALQER